MDDEEFGMMLSFVFRTSKESSENVKKERRVWIRKICEKRLFFTLRDKDISLLFRPAILLGSTRVELF